MIPLNDEQREHLHEVTHDLMLLSFSSNGVVSSLICDVLGVLYGGVLGATENETAAYAARANKQICEQFTVELAEGALH